MNKCLITIVDEVKTVVSGLDSELLLKLYNKYGFYVDRL